MQPFPHEVIKMELSDHTPVEGHRQGWLDAAGSPYRTTARLSAIAGAALLLVTVLALASPVATASPVAPLSPASGTHQGHERWPGWSSASHNGNTGRIGRSGAPTISV